MKTFKKGLALLLSILMVFSLFSATIVTASAATDTTVYFVNSNDWSEVNCYCYSTVGGEEKTWPGNPATVVDAANGVYSYDVANYDHFIFNSGKGDGKPQTANLVSADHYGKYFDMKTGKSYATLEEALAAADSAVSYDYFVCGEAGLCGGEWSLAQSSCGMTKNADGSYTKVFENIAAGTYQYKVNNGTWGENYPSENATVKVATNGSTVTITLTAKKEVQSSVQAPTAETTAPATDAPTDASEAPEPATFAIRGTFTSWDNNDAMVAIGETLVTAGFELEAGDYEFKIFSNDVWYGNGGTIEDTTGENAWTMKDGDGNCTLKATGGYYAFNLDTATMKLSVAHTPKDTEPAEPSTQAPTTEPASSEPETQAPTTEPATAAPETQAPTTEPATAAPETQAPTTEPATAAPETQAPTTEPATAAPETQAPTTEPASSEAPAATTVAIKGDFEVALTSEDNNVYTGSVELEDGDYEFSVYVNDVKKMFWSIGSEAEGVDYTWGISLINKSIKITGADKGTYTFTYDAAADTLSMKAVGAKATEPESSDAPTQAPTSEPASSEAPVAKTYSVVGYINGADVGFGADEAGEGYVLDENGQTTITTNQNTYIFVKTTDNQTQYMTNDWLGEDVTSATLYDKNTLDAKADKLFVPANKVVVITVVENEDGTLTISYEITGDAPTDATTPSETTPAPSETEAPKTEWVALEPTPLDKMEGLFFVVAGDETLCGSDWKPADRNNELTYNEETRLYEKVYENVAAGTYNFKVTAGGDWDNADFNLVGDAKFGGPNATITVAEDGATVKILFDNIRAYAFINDEQVKVEVAIPDATDPSASETTPDPTDPSASETTPNPTETEPQPTETVPVPTDPAKEMTAKASDKKIAAGETSTVTVENAEGKVKFTSSNKDVAKVSKKGVVTALTKGKTTITATDANGNVATVKIKVTSSPKLSKKTASVRVKKTAKITVKGAATKVKVTKCNVATFKVKGNKITVRGKKAGKATVKVKVNGVKLKLKVTVKK